MIRRPPRSTQSRSSAASDVYKRQLILNAMQAMPGGGKLNVSAFSDGAIAVCVSDTGTGIQEDFKEKLFKPLFTGKAKGTGLGLAVVKRIVEAHNGEIIVESEVCLLYTSDAADD